MSYRDDREALYAQVTALRARLAALESERDDRADLAEEVTTLRAQLAVCELERESTARARRRQRARDDSLPPMEGPGTDPLAILASIVVAALVAFCWFVSWVRR